jgi:hypothetical protein
MSDLNKVILYQAYGLNYIYNQVLFSILTLYHHVQGNFEGIKVVIYTDKPEMFLKYKNEIPISTEPLTKKHLKKYRGESGFVHRVKICIIQDCFTKYKSDIFYLDSDTYFTRPPHSLLSKIDADTSIMNSDDYDLLSADDLYENKDWLLIRRAIRGYEYNIANKKVKIPLTTRMWNAGVIGLSVENKNLLKPILDLCDQIYTNKKVFTAEQFAFSYFLQNKTKLITSEDIIFHYWKYFKPFRWREIYTHHFKIFFKRYRKASVKEQALQANELTLRHDQLRAPKKIFANKIFNRLDKIAQVIIKGKIKTSI